MLFTPVLILHICSGVSGVLSGGTAVFLRKGSRRHRVAGNVFVLSMIGLSLSAIYLALVKSESSNVLAGTFTSYLVITAWTTARRNERQTGFLDWIGLLAIIAIITGYTMFGLEAARSVKGSKDGVPAGMYFFMGCVGLLAAVGDVRMLVSRGVSGTSRLARHLWRMCFALFIASGSIFLARPHLFPAFMRRTYILAVLGFLPLILMVFWLFRVRFLNKSTSRSLQLPGGVYSVRA